MCARTARLRLTQYSQHAQSISSRRSATMAALHLLRPLFPRSPCPGCRQLSRTARRLEEPASRPKVRSMPTAKRVEPEKGAFESLEAAPAKMATEGVQEADVAEVIYRCTPKRSPAFYYVTMCAFVLGSEVELTSAHSVFLVGVGVNVAEAWRLDSMGTLTCDYALFQSGFELTCSTDDLFCRPKRRSKQTRTSAIQSVERPFSAPRCS